MYSLLFTSFQYLSRLNGLVTPDPYLLSHEDRLRHASGSDLTHFCDIDGLLTITIDKQKLYPIQAFVKK